MTTSQQPSTRRHDWPTLLLAALVLLLVVGGVRAERIKDLATVQGVRSNPLIGYGLVIGLDGTGDRTSQVPFTAQSLRSMLTQLGVAVPAGTNLQLKNVAAVAIHAELPPFAKPGQRIDITVGSIGNAASLRGGSLLMSPLKGADGQVYAIAQGNLVVGGFGVAGNDGSRISVNVPSTGRIPNGATVERVVPNAFGSGSEVVLNLHTPDFTTMNRLRTAIQHYVGYDAIVAMDAVSIAVAAPPDPTQRVTFMAMLENIQVEPGDAPARVVVNSRTGTVVIGSHVRVKSAAVTHGSLSVTIREDFAVSQPQPFGAGQTAVVPDSELSVDPGDGRMFLFDAGVTLEAIVRAVNQVGAAPGDLVAILEALKQAGALRAELVVI